MIAIDPAAFIAPEEFIARTEAYLADIKGSPLAEGSDGIRFPGERMADALWRQSKSGVEVLAETWKILERYAVELGVSPPAVEPVAP